MTVSYPVEVPSEETAGEEIEDAMKDSEPKMKNEDEETGKDVEHTLTFSGPQDFRDHSNNEAEETEDARYQFGETVDSFSQQQDFDNSQYNDESKETGKTSLRHGQPNEIVQESKEFRDTNGNESEELDAIKQEDTENNFSDSLNFSDEQEGVSEQNANENGNEDIENVMVIKQKEPSVSSSDQQEDGNEVPEEDVTVGQDSKSKDKDNNGHTVMDDSVNDKHDDDDDDKNNSAKKGDSMLEQKQTFTDKNGKDDNDEHDGAVYDVDIYQENSNSSSNATKLDQNGADNGTMEGSSTVVQTSSGDENDTQSMYSSQQPNISADAETKPNPPVEINFAPSVKLLKPDQKLLNEIEEDHALRLKQKEKKQHAQGWSFFLTEIQSQSHADQQFLKIFKHV